jgi:hypothetical protein
MTVKLVESNGHALTIEVAAPTGYGLGRAGWVDVPVQAEDVTAGLLCDWIEESYRAFRQLAGSANGPRDASSASADPDSSLPAPGRTIRIAER